MKTSVIFAESSCCQHRKSTLSRVKPNARDERGQVGRKQRQQVKGSRDKLIEWAAESTR